MADYKFSKQLINRITSLVFVFALCFVTSGLCAQNAADFSGKWEYDKTKSTPGTMEANYEGKLVRQISQNPAVFSYADIYIRPGSPEWKTSDEIFNLDGKEQILKDDSGTRKKSAKWSPDKKALTLTYIEIYTEGGVSKELLIEEIYNLSGDGKTLTVETFSKNQVTGETRSTKIYHKK